MRIPLLRLAADSKTLYTLEKSFHLSSHNKLLEWGSELMLTFSKLLAFMNPKYVVFVSPETGGNFENMIFLVYQSVINDNSI